MDSKRVLSLLGLALRGGNLAVGEEPVEAAARARDARAILLAGDAAGATCRRAEHFAQAGQCLLLQTPFSKEELGTALGRSSVAMAAVTDTGLANAVVQRLAEGDPGRYGQAAAQMELKVKRARERQAERLAHEKNVRQGKRRAGETPDRDPQGAPPGAGRSKGAPPRGKGAPRYGRGAPSGNGGAPRYGKRVPSGDGGASKYDRGAPSGSGGAPGHGKGAASGNGGAPRGPGRGTSPKDRRTGPAPGGSRPAAGGRGRVGPGARAKPYAHSRPVKKGKGSFRKRES